MMNGRGIWLRPYSLSIIRAHHQISKLGRRGEEPAEGISRRWRTGSSLLSKREFEEETGVKPIGRFHLLARFVARRMATQSKSGALLEQLHPNLNTFLSKMGQLVNICSVVATGNC